MRSVQLVPFVSDMTGDNGLIFLGTEGDEIVSDTEGGLLAHDLVEHQNGFARIGCPMDELEALGGVWHTRGRWGDFRNTRFSPAETIANDVGQVANDAHHWTPLNLTTRAHDHDDDFNEILVHARKSLENRDYDLAEDFPIEAYLADARSLMRTGFNKANRRFGTGFKSNSTYRAVKAAVAPFCKDPTPCTLRYGNGEATCHENPFYN